MMTSVGLSSSRWSIWAPIVGALISGTFVTISNKALYTTNASGTCPSPHPFEKPYFLTLCMFVGEAMCLVMYKGQQWYRNRELTRDAPNHPTITSVAVRHHIPDSSSSSHDHTSNDTDHEDDEDERQRKPLISPSSSPPSTTSSQHHRSPSPLSASSSSSSQSDEECPVLPITLPTKQPTVLTKVIKPPRYYYLIFAMFDLAGSAVGGVGLMYVEASIHQMLRGSMVVFTALAATVILHTHQSRRQWLSVSIVCVGLVLVGTCDMLRTSYYAHHKSSVAHFTSSQTATGIILVMLASAINSIQNVYEERMMKGGGSGIAYYVDPMELVGWEGIFGLFLSFAVMIPAVHAIPGSDCGSVENFGDTLTMLTTSSLIITFLIGYIISIMFLNLTLLQIAQRLTSVHRNVLNSCRVILVWLVSVMLYYGLTHHTFGENLDRFSAIQLAGFIVLIVGSVMYGMSKSAPHPVAATASISSVVTESRDDDVTSDGEMLSPSPPRVEKTGSRSSLLARNVPVM